MWMFVTLGILAYVVCGVCYFFYKVTRIKFEDQKVTWVYVAVLWPVALATELFLMRIFDFFGKRKTKLIMKEKKIINEKAHYRDSGFKQ